MYWKKFTIGDGVNQLLYWDLYDNENNQYQPMIEIIGPLNFGTNHYTLRDHSVTEYRQTVTGRFAITLTYEEFNYIILHPDEWFMERYL